MPENTAPETTPGTDALAQGVETSPAAAADTAGIAAQDGAAGRTAAADSAAAGAAVPARRRHGRRARRLATDEEELRKDAEVRDAQEAAQRALTGEITRIGAPIIATDEATSLEATRDDADADADPAVLADAAASAESGTADSDDDDDADADVDAGTTDDVAVLESGDADLDDAAAADAEIEQPGDDTDQMDDVAEIDEEGTEQYLADAADDAPSLEKDALLAEDDAAVGAEDVSDSADLLDFSEDAAAAAESEEPGADHVPWDGLASEADADALLDNGLASETDADARLDDEVASEADDTALERDELSLEDTATAVVEPGSAGDAAEETPAPSGLEADETAAAARPLRGAVAPPSADTPLPKVRRFGKRARIIEVDESAPADPTSQAAVADGPAAAAAGSPWTDDGSAGAGASAGSVGRSAGGVATATRPHADDGIVRDADGVELGELSVADAPGPRPAPRFEGRVLNRPEQRSGRPLLWIVWALIIIAVIALLVLLFTGVLGGGTAEAAGFSSSALLSFLPDASSTPTPEVSAA